MTHEQIKGYFCNIQKQKIFFLLSFLQALTDFIFFHGYCKRQVNDTSIRIHLFYR